MWRKAFIWLSSPTAFHPTVVSSSAFSSKDATTNRVVNAALSANDKAIYCIVTPCECLMAIVILAQPVHGMPHGDRDRHHMDASAHHCRSKSSSPATDRSHVPA